MDYKIVHTTLQGKCVCCGKRAPDCPNWERCYERRLMSSRGYGGFFVCVLCGEGYDTRDELPHAGACLAQYLRRIDELRDSQVADRLVPYVGRAAAAKSEVRPSTSRSTGIRDETGALGDLPPALAKMYPGAGKSWPRVQKTRTFVTGRPKTVRITVKDKCVQAQEKMKDKATQTSNIDLQPGQDVAYVRWTGVARARRPLLEADQARIYTLMENLRRAVVDVLGSQELVVATDGNLEGKRDAAAFPNVNVDDSFASAERRLDEIEEILRVRKGALGRAMRRAPSSGESEDLTDSDSEPAGEDTEELESTEESAETNSDPEIAQDGE